VIDIIEAKHGRSQPAVQMLQVDDESADQRLDNYLIRQLKGVPKSHIYQLIRSGQVRVNKARAEPHLHLTRGDLVRIPPVRLSVVAPEKKPLRAQARGFAVLFEDEGILAIHKPAGVAVHGGSGVSSGVIEQLRAARPDAPLLELVHRLDRETSGVLLVAKRRSALRAIQAQFRERETVKTYLALVRGQWPSHVKVLDQPLLKYNLPGEHGAEGEKRVRVAKAGETDAMRAVTLVQVIRAWRDASLLQVNIKTGRTHQIRVHLAHAGHPILGDDKYGDFEINRQLAKEGLKRMFLHAWRLGLTHPVSGESLALQAELAPELQAFLVKLNEQESTSF
jgi:23S rRNA pseudouridine955/2504/2580 synthase